MLSRTRLTLAGMSLLALASAAGCSRSAQPRPAPAPAPSRTSGTTRTARTTPRPTTTTPPAPSRANASAFAEELVTRTNAARRSANLPPLARSMNLMRAAELQANQMAKTDKLEHDLPGTAYPTLGSRLAAVQYVMRAAGENIGEGYQSPSAAIAGWMASTGHRANILSPNFTEIGAAMAPGPNGSVYWVQVFGRPR